MMKMECVSILWNWECGGDDDEEAFFNFLS